MPSTPSSGPPEPRRSRAILAAVAIAVVLIVGGITAIVLAGDDGSPSSRSAMVDPAKVAVDGVATVGQPAPDFTATTLDGKTVRLRDYAGKAVVVNFWQSACVPCRAEFPMFRRMLERHRGDFVLLGVDYKDIPSDARAFVRDQRATWPTVGDPDNAIATAYGVRAVPQTFFIAPDGTISQRIYSELSGTRFEEELARIT